MQTADNIIILQHSPTIACEPLDMALALAAFEQDLAILLIGDGLFYALEQSMRTSANNPQGKSASKVLASLPMYDCDKLYYSQAHLEQFNLSAEHIGPHFSALNEQQIKQLIASSKHCISL